MSWRRGFLRLWLVFALLWWGGWGVHFVNTGAFDVQSKQGPWTEYQLHDALKALRNAEKLAQAGDQQAVEDTKRLAEIVDLLSNQHQLLEAERRGVLPADTQALLDEARRRGLVPPLNQRHAFANWPFAVVPPFVVLVVGWVVVWVLKGFQRGKA